MIAKSLVRERLRTGLSLAEIARRAGIAKSTLSQLEAGNGNPSIETLWSLCVALDIPFARLLEPQAAEHRSFGVAKARRWLPNWRTTRRRCSRPARRARGVTSIFLMLNPALIVFLSRIHRVQLSILL
jgi:transcriptional regulator with XRE-family HTH domain